MMKRFARYIPVITAAIAIVVALMVLSRIVLTLDTITHPGYQIAYVAGVVLLLAGLVTFAWLKLRRPPVKVGQERARRPPPEARLNDLFARHHLDDGGQAPRPGHPSPSRRSAGTLSVAIAGLDGTGKSTIAAALANASSGVKAGKALEVELRELGGLDTDRGRNLERLAPALVADVTLFIVDQDLRDYEQAAIAALARRNVKIVVVINKIDLMRADALAETRQAIAGKLAGLVCETDIVSVSAAPKPLVRMLGDGENLSEEDVSGVADVSAILERFALIASERRRAGLSISVSPS